GIHGPFDAPGNERGLAAIADAEQRRAVPDRAARVEQAELAVRLHPVAEPRGRCARREGDGRGQGEQENEGKNAAHFCPAGARVTSASTRPAPTRAMRAAAMRSGSSLEASFSQVSQSAASVRFAETMSRSPSS